MCISEAEIALTCPEQPIHLTARKNCGSANRPTCHTSCGYCQLNLYTVHKSNHQPQQGVGLSGQSTTAAARLDTPAVNASMLDDANMHEQHAFTFPQQKDSFPSASTTQQHHLMTPPWNCGYQLEHNSMPGHEIPTALHCSGCAVDTAFTSCFTPHTVCCKAAGMPAALRPGVRPINTCQKPSHNSVLPSCTRCSIQTGMQPAHKLLVALLTTAPYAAASASHHKPIADLQRSSAVTYAGRHHTITQSSTAGHDRYTLAEVLPASLHSCTVVHTF